MLKSKNSTAVVCFIFSLDRFWKEKFRVYAFLDFFLFGFCVASLVLRNESNKHEAATTNIVIFKLQENHVSFCEFVKWLYIFEFESNDVLVIVDQGDHQECLPSRPSIKLSWLSFDIFFNTRISTIKAHKRNLNYFIAPSTSFYYSLLLLV